MSGDSPRRLDFRVAGALAGQRLDKALCGLLPGLSRAAVMADVYKRQICRRTFCASIR